MIWLLRLSLFAFGNLAFVAWWNSMGLANPPRWWKATFFAVGLMCWLGLIATFL
jgi:hypothetical protein